MASKEENLELTEAVVHPNPNPNQASTLTSSSPTSSSLSLATAQPPPEQINLVYFLAGNKSEIALVPTNSSSDDIKDLFRSAAEAGPCDIVKLYTKEGRLINISPKIPPNTPSSPYRLEVLAVHCNGMLIEQVGIDLLSLEKRVSALEKILKNQGSPSESIQELKEEVSQLRNKLENYEHLSWLGFYKALHPSPLPTPPKTPGVGYHKKSREHKQLICDKFLKLSDVVLTRETCQLLREPTFDNWQWEDEEMLVLLQQMYLDLDLPRKFDIEISILRNFLVSVYHHYNDVPFHNFRHCFCVTQMMFGMITALKLSERIGDTEILILLTSCICHDLDHPGYNNLYQINAQTELALRYNDISPLENHHCSIAFRILENMECNIFRNLPTGTYRKIREGIIRCILATDMARHNEIVNNFREIAPYFDATNRAHINLLSMVLIKVADISNEARPMDVAEPWLDCLLAEFFQQSDTEKLEGLPVAPFMDRDKITKPSSQCSFIGLVLLPLFEALGSFFTELDPLIVQPVRDALEYYRRLNEASQSTRQHRKSTDVGLSSTSSTALTTLTTTMSTPGTTLAITSGTPTTTPTMPPPSSTSSFVGTPSTMPTPPHSAPLLQSSTSGSIVSFNNQNQPQPPHNTNLCDNKLPSDPCNVNRVSRSSSVSMPNSSSNSEAMADSSSASRNSNPITIAHRRASQLLVRGSGSVTSLQYQRGFPGAESIEDDEVDSDEDAITEVAVSEKALKFKIATESSFDYSSSRKGSRENKSESSGQSASGQSQNNVGRDGLSMDAMTTPFMSSSSRSKMEVLPQPQSPLAVTMTTGTATAFDGSSSSPSGYLMSPNSESPSSTTMTTPTGGAKGTKAAKESFFSRLKLFTERLSISADSGTGGSGSGSPPSSQKGHSQGFNYFRRSGRKGSGRKSGVQLPILDDRPSSSSSAVSGTRRNSVKHSRGSHSDPEGSGEDFLRRRPHADHTQSEGERESELASPDCSPALSRSAAAAAAAEQAKSSSSSWKQTCSGSLDSILSKEEPKRSPARRLMLPRFSSFVHKRTRMGFMRRLSPKSDHQS